LNWPPLPPVPEVIDAAWRIVLPAGGLALAVPIAARLAFGRSALKLALPIGAAAGLATAFHLRAAVPWKPDDYGSGWIHVVWAAALAAGAVAACLSAWWSWIPKLAGVAAAVWVTLPEDRRTDPTWAVGLAAAMAVPWLASPSSNVEADKRYWPERSIWLTAMLGALSIVALYSHYLRVTDFAMMAACATAGGAMACLLLGRDGREIEGLGIVTLPALALTTWSEASSEIPLAGFWCIGLAALPMVALNWLPYGGWKSFLLRGMFVLIPAAVAVGIALAYEQASFG
jgi:hypothetical protein